MIMNTQIPRFASEATPAVYVDVKLLGVGQGK